MLNRPILVIIAAVSICLSSFGLQGCGSSGPAQAAVTKSLQVRVQSLDHGTTVRGDRLLQPKAVARFYEARKSSSAWSRKDAEQIVAAIRGVERDGLRPAEYHLNKIESLLTESKGTQDAKLVADLDVLLTDAVTAIVDNVRYGRVRPSTLNAGWAVDPRDDMPPIEQDVARIAESDNPAQAIEALKPNHFIYQGLVGALAQMREFAEKGGWATIPYGKTIKPGGVDARIPKVRARLAVTGELDKGAGSDSSRKYDAALLEAVKLFQARHRLNEDGIIDKTTLAAMNVSAAARAAQVRVNLERARWVLGGLTGDFVLVNLPAFKAYLIQDGKNVWEGRTQIGEEASKTPTFRARMETVVLNPDWTVPPTILADEVLAGMREGRDEISKKRLRIYDGSGNEVDPGSIDWGSAEPGNFPYSLKQLPGEDNALGRVKFLFPNKYSIYLHDTPNKHLFETEKRTFSHGCIRVEHPLELAEILLSGQDGWSPAKIQETLATGDMKHIALQRKPAVLIVYWTVSVGATGEVRYAQDIYNLDQPLLNSLQGAAKRV
jgi:murein L,D-transpeptidase YcbB/YkuD